MGKIRVKTLGDEGLEEKQKKDALKRKEAKRTVKIPGLKGGERIVAVGPTEEEIAKIEVPKETEETEETEVKAKKAKSKTSKKEKTRSKKYQTIAKLVDQTKTYSLQDALSLLLKLHLAKFDETVELHINTVQKGISAQTTLPHGSGKKIRIEIASDELIENISKGKIDFDVLLATPDIMPKLARVAKFLGPRGLMPNPKNRTITSNPEALVKKYEGGQVTLKTEAKAPIMHIIVGKLSFDKDKLTENVQAVFNAVKLQNIKNVTLKSTMSPGIKIKPTVSD